MTTEGKIIKNTAISIGAYLVAYTLSLGIILSILRETNLLDTFALILTAFPAFFTGNLLPSVVGSGTVYLCNKVINDDDVITTRSRFFTALIVIGIEAVGSIVRYAMIGTFEGASFALIAILTIDAIKTNKKYKALITPPEADVDDGSYGDNQTDNND